LKNAALEYHQIQYADGSLSKIMAGKFNLDQLCPTHSPQAACGPGKGFVRPSLGFRCGKSILHTANLSLFW